MQRQELQDMGPSLLKLYLGLIHKITGITMNPSKLTMIQGRIRHRIQDLKLISYESYYEFLQSNLEERELFINSITTNETSFFRTARVWSYFAEEFLPKWSETNKGNKLRIWSAASSTGEEAYTIAFLCEEYKKKNIYFEYEIHATDISTAVIQKAEEGIYSGRAIELLKKHNVYYLHSYFDSTVDGYKIKDRIRSKVKFSQHNLLNVNLKKDFFDIVFLRNVLIYFESNEQKTVLENIQKTLTRNGVLVVGESESLNNLKTTYKYHCPLIYYKGA